MLEQHRFFSATPLAARLRPTTIEQVIGQSKALAHGSALRRLITTDTARSTSILIWGPPGTGKTSIASLLASTKGMKFVQLSAISAGVKEVRDVIDQAKSDLALYQQQTVLFLDEIHRFSKSQQDSLLPAVEAGWVLLVSATTENPAFAVISPLLSRSLVVQLETPTDSDIDLALSRAIEDERGFANQARLAKEARALIIDRSGGDFRRALTILDASAATAAERVGNEADVVDIEVGDVEASTTRAANRYDRAGDQHYDIISAFIKSVRGSDVDVALHYLARMIDGGEDPRFIARRLVILAAEDIGLADPQALVLATATADAVALIGMPEGRIPLAECTIYLALAPKSNSAYLAINKALSDVSNGLTPAVPSALRSTGFGTYDAKREGKGYRYPHDDERSIVEQEYAAKEVLSKTYFSPKTVGPEARYFELWSKLREVIRHKPKSR